MNLSYFGYFRKLFNAGLLVFIMELPVSAILTCTYSQLTISVTDTTGFRGFERDFLSKLENKKYDGTEELVNKIEAIIKLYKAAYNCVGWMGTAYLMEGLSKSTPQGREVSLPYEDPSRNLPI